MTTPKIKMIKENDLFDWRVEQILEVEEVHGSGDHYIYATPKFNYWLDDYYGMFDIEIPADELIRTGYAIYLD